MPSNYRPEDNTPSDFGTQDSRTTTSDSSAAGSDSPRYNPYVSDPQDYTYYPPQSYRSVPRRSSRKLIVLLCIFSGLIIFSIGVVGSYILLHYSAAHRLGLMNPPDVPPVGTTAAPAATTAVTTRFVPVENPPTIVIEESPIEPEPEPVYDETGRQVLSIPQIVAKAKPSVVGVLSYRQTDTSEASSLGSGIIMSEDGFILTNAHVVTGGVRFQIILDDSVEHDAELIGYDEKSDIAIMKIDAEGLTPAEFGDSDALIVGDIAVAIGNPTSLDLAGTVTSGIISARDREIVVDSSGNILKLIQTDAAINPGNSGGPLLNKYGQVIGINTIKMNSSYYEGLCFAIPTNVFKPIVDELFAKGYVSGYPSIGISGASVTYTDQAYGMPAGVFVSIVNEKSDAFAKGIVPGDIITHVNGEPVTSVSDINIIKNGFGVGDSLTLTIFRNSETFDVEITLVDTNDLN